MKTLQHNLTNMQQQLVKEKQQIQDELHELLLAKFDKNLKLVHNQNMILN